MKHPSQSPQQSKPEELRTLGHKLMTPLEALRAHCIDCSGHDPEEVAHCPVKRCPSWPFRFGRNPWRIVSDAQRAASRANARHLRSGSRQNHGNLADGAALAGPGTGCPPDDPIPRQNHGGSHGE